MLKLKLWNLYFIGVKKKQQENIMGRTVIRNGYLHVRGGKRKKRRAVKRTATYCKKNKKVDLVH